MYSARGHSYDSIEPGSYSSTLHQLNRTRRRNEEDTKNVLEQTGQSAVDSVGYKSHMGCGARLGIICWVNNKLCSLQRRCLCFSATQFVLSPQACIRSSRQVIVENVRTAKMTFSSQELIQYAA
jgi:hypothetical protein